MVYGEGNLMWFIVKWHFPLSPAKVLHEVLQDGEHIEFLEYAQQAGVIDLLQAKMDIPQNFTLFVPTPQALTSKYRITVDWITIPQQGAFMGIMSMASKLILEGTEQVLSLCWYSPVNMIYKEMDSFTRRQQFGLFSRSLLFILLRYYWIIMNVNQIWIQSPPKESIHLWYFHTAPFSKLAPLPQGDHRKVTTQTQNVRNLWPAL